VALVVATLVGISLGIFTGARSSGLLPSLVRGASLVCISMPPLLTSLVFVFIAARTGWLPAGGMVSATATDPSWSSWGLDVLWHLPLPALALALPIAATFERLQSQTMGEAVRQPFVLAAVARGVPRERVILRCVACVGGTGLCGHGLAIGALLPGSFIVEPVTAWPGLDA
jgi:peptide/nickel transport system permease protein